MARIPAWLNDIAEKYVQEIVAGVTGRVTYKDAWLEPDCLIVPTQHISSALDGWQAWKLPVVVNSKKGTYKYGTPVETVIGEPSVYAFTQWAKDQSAKTLRELLASRRIKATGDLVSILAYRLAYEYEKISLTKTGQYLETAVRRDHIAALDTLLNTEGRGKHPNELAIVMIRDALTTGKKLRTLSTIGANDMAAKDESPGEIRKRLLAEKETQEKAKPAETKKKDAKAEPKKKSGKVAAESDAIKKGKGGKTVAAPEPEPDVVTSNDTAEETEDMSKKKGAKKGKAVKTPKAAKPAAPKTGKGGLTDAKKEIPLGSIVKYIGDRNPKLKGKTGEVLRYSGPNGVAIRYKDGLVGTASPTALEMVTKGKAK